MMRSNNIHFSSNFSRLELLEKLKANAATHKKIVEEARAGYLLRASEALKARLEELASGKLVHLQFQMAVPVDQSSVYATTIEMLEMSKDETIKLDADEFRQLVQDEWDWTQGFLVSNRAYSSTAGGEALKKGY